MLVDLNGNMQPQVGTQPHWAMFAAFSTHPDLFDPMLQEIAQLVNGAVAANPARPWVDSRQAGEAAIGAMTSWWHGEFSRRFAHFANGSQRGIFGMSLWNYLARSAHLWSFSAIGDSHGYGQDATQYWRI